MYRTTINLYNSYWSEITKSYLHCDVLGQGEFLHSISSAYMNLANIKQKACQIAPVFNSEHLTMGQRKKNKREAKKVEIKKKVMIEKDEETTETQALEPDEEELWPLYGELDGKIKGRPTTFDYDPPSNRLYAIDTEGTVPYFNPAPESSSQPYIMSMPSSMDYYPMGRPGPPTPLYQFLPSCGVRNYLWNRNDIGPGRAPYREPYIQSAQ